VHVLFVIGDRTCSGRARALSVAARGLSRRGFVSVVMAPADGVAFAELARSQGSALLFVPLPPGRKRPGVRALRRVLREHAIDTIMVHSDADYLTAAIATVAVKPRPVIVRRWALGERQRATRAARLAERLADATHLYVGREVPATADDGGHALELGVALPELPVAVLPDIPKIVCFYDAHATRQASRVLRAVAMLRKRQRRIALTMVAADDVPERLRMQAAALGLTRVARWRRAPDRPTEVLAHAAAAVIASGSDDAAFGTLDAMAHAVPVIAPRAALSERYVANGISGVLLDVFDAPAIAAALAAILSDDERRDAMGSVARARVARDFTEDAHVQGLETLLRSRRPVHAVADVA
jgi:glycosyltransferase involved in cell wall biosynthesis